MVNWTFIVYHHITHGRKVYNAKNEVEPEKCLVQDVSQLLMSLTFLLLRVKILQEVDHLSEHSTVLLWGIRLNDANASFGFWKSSKIPSSHIKSAAAQTRHMQCLFHSSSPSSSFSSFFAAFSGVDSLLQQQKMRPPSLATRVSTSDTNMLSTMRTRQTQKWVPAGQTHRLLADKRDTVVFTCLVCAAGAFASACELTDGWWGCSGCLRGARCSGWWGTWWSWAPEWPWKSCVRRLPAAERSWPHQPGRSEYWAALMWWRGSDTWFSVPPEEDGRHNFLV